MCRHNNSTSNSNRGCPARPALRYQYRDRVSSACSHDGCLQPRPIVYSKPPVEAGILYAMADAANGDAWIYQVDESDARCRLIVKTFLRNATALAVNPVTRCLYAVADAPTDVDDDNQWLYKIDLHDGRRICPIGSTGFEEISTLSFSPSGVLYGWSISGAPENRGLLIFNLQTGAASQIGSNRDLSQGVALCFGPDGVLYLKNRGIVENQNDEPVLDLYTVDLATGEVTPYVNVAVDLEGFLEMGGTWSYNGFACSPNCGCSYATIAPQTPTPFQLVRFDLADEVPSAALVGILRNQETDAEIENVTALLFTPWPRSDRSCAGQICWRRCCLYCRNL